MVKIKKTFRFILFLLAISVLTTSCKKGAKPSRCSNSDSNQNVTLNIKSEPHSLDPRKFCALSDSILIRMFMDGLTRTDKEGKASLALADKVTVSSDLLTYTFTLKESQWSNGDPLTAQDFSYAWKKTLSPNFNSPNANMLYIIKNAQEAKQGTLPLSLVGIETPNDKTIVVKLNHPAPYMLDLLTHPIFFPINRSVDRENPNWAESQSSFIGNGPFKIHEWKHNDLITAIKNNLYWDEETVHLTDLKMVMKPEMTDSNMFEQHELAWDDSSSSAAQIEANQSFKDKNELQTSPVLGTKWISINTEKTPFVSNKMRQAFAYAIDREQLVDHITERSETPATSIVPDVMGLHSAPLFKDGNMSHAQVLFDEAMEDLELTLETFPSISLVYVSGTRDQLIAEAIQNQWQNVFNITVTLEPIEATNFLNRVSSKDYVLSIGDLFAKFNDPINFLEAFKSKNTLTNNTQWEDLNYQELLETSYFCQNPRERDQILKQSEEIIVEQMPVIPLFHFNMLYTQDKTLKDVVLSNLGNIDFKYAHIEKE